MLKNVSSPSVKRCLVAFHREIYVMYLWGPSTYAHCDSAQCVCVRVCVCVCGRAEQWSLFWFIHGCMRGGIESSLSISELLLFYLSVC